MERKGVTTKAMPNFFNGKKGSKTEHGLRKKETGIAARWTITQKRKERTEEGVIKRQGSWFHDCSFNGVG